MKVHAKEISFDVDEAKKMKKKDWVDNHKNVPHLQDVDLETTYDELVGKKEAPSKTTDEAK